MSDDLLMVSLAEKCPECCVAYIKYCENANAVGRSVAISIFACIALIAVTAILCYRRNTVR